MNDKAGVHFVYDLLFSATFYRSGIDMASGSGQEQAIIHEVDSRLIIFRATDGKVVFNFFFILCVFQSNPK